MINAEFWGDFDEVKQSKRRNAQKAGGKIVEIKRMHKVKEI